MMMVPHTLFYVRYNIVVYCFNVILFVGLYVTLLE